MRGALVWLLLGAGICEPAARGADPPSGASTDEGRRAFIEGTELVKKAQWADALAAFERSSRLRPHPTTTFSMGACERALGRYSRARATLKRALAESAANGDVMPAELAADAQAFIGEIEQLLAHVAVHIDPPQTEITVDGRPLEAEPGQEDAYPPILVAGMRPPGRGAPPLAPDFELIVEPGSHVIMLARKGYSNAVVQRTFEPGAHTTLPLVLDRLPATIHVSSSQPGAVVAVDDVDVGSAPVDVLRAAGSYRIAARMKGFVTYRTRVTVQAGEQVELLAPLAVEKRPLYKQWWFWTGAVVVVGALAIGLGVGLSPPPPYNGGSTGWVAQPR